MDADQLVDLGNGLYKDGDAVGAMRHYRSAVALDPDCARAHYNLGVVTQRLGLVDEALAHYSRVVPSSGVFAQARMNLSILQLLRHDFAAGWEGYELRLATPKVATRQLPLPRLEPSTAQAARRVAILKEQGIGDQILYSTLLPELSRSYEAVVEVDARLVGAYRRSLPQVTFVTERDPVDAFAACDHQSPIASLGRLLRPTRESFRRQPGAVLSADESRAGQAREALGPGPKVGISWRTFQLPGRDHVSRVRNVPLEAFAALGGSGVRLVDLQYGDVDADREAFDRLAPGMRVRVPGLDVFNDLEGLLAAIAACDLILTPSNVTAHLAGILGKKTWLVFLGDAPPFHYWSPGPEGRSLWYPGVQVMNDPAWESWEEALRDLAARLRSDGLQ